MLATELRYNESVVVVIGEAEENETTKRLTALSEQRLNEWAEVVEAHPDRKLDQQDTAEIFSHLLVELDDGRGGIYRWTGSAFGGTGTEWRAEWHFTPGPDPSVSTLTIRSTSADGVNQVVAPIPPSSPR